MTIIKNIATETYLLDCRASVKGKSIESCQFDDLETTQHFGLLSQELAGIISLFNKKK
jgi:hypothetical protein